MLMAAAVMLHGIEQRHLILEMCAGTFALRPQLIAIRPRHFPMQDGRRRSETVLRLGPGE